MSADTFRQEKLTDFTVIRNAIFKDYTLSAKALGVACKLLSLPPDWDYSIRGLVTLFSDGEASIRNALTELEEHGYLRRERIREGGKLGKSVYVITDCLDPDENLEKPHVENPHVVNQAQLNTKESKTKRFIPPTIEEIRAYIEEKGFSVDAERFYDYYESNGWVVGKNKMKDYKATIRNWQRRQHEFRSNDQFRSGYKERGGIRTATRGGDSGDAVIGATLPPME